MFVHGVFDRGGGVDIVVGGDGSEVFESAAIIIKYYMIHILYR